MPGVLGEIKKNDQTSELSSGSSAPRMAPEPSKNHLEYPGWISTNGASPVLRACPSLKKKPGDAGLFQIYTFKTRGAARE